MNAVEVYFPEEIRCHHATVNKWIITLKVLVTTIDALEHFETG